MRILANENFPLDAVNALRELGHDVVWIRTDAPGSKDDDILAWAMRENRIVVTFDKDFGELAFRSKLPATCGIILFRFTIRSSGFAASRVTAAISAQDDWEGHFAVVDDSQVRIRSLPDNQE